MTFSLALCSNNERPLSRGVVVDYLNVRRRDPLRRVLTDYALLMLPLVRVLKLSLTLGTVLEKTRAARHVRQVVAIDNPDGLMHHLEILRYLFYEHLDNRLRLLLGKAVRDDLLSDCKGLFKHVFK